MIGWYHSGPKLRSSDLEINELFKRYTPHPVLVIVDVKPKDVEIPTDAYFAIEEIKDVKLLDGDKSYVEKLKLAIGRYRYDQDVYACAVGNCS